jgi:hypothetical protein
MNNVYSSDGIAEDLIRSFVQMACAELHAKTRHEKMISELENGLIDTEDNEVLHNASMSICDLEKDIIAYSELRRSDMRYLYSLYGGKGNLECWCTVKHLGISAMTAFEAWQASDNSPVLLHYANEKNKLFIKSLCEFLGVEITSCASCFADALNLNKEGDNLQSDSLEQY